MINVTVKGVADIGKLMPGGNEQAVTLPPGSTLRELLEVLVGRYGEAFAQRIFKTDRAELRQDLRLLVNGRDIFFLNRLETVLNDRDHVSLLPLLAGG